ncbi:hypothetical protein [Myxococcus sp. AS-1-15]|uniref:hypothetical protein n=1 Tax=Myxococcus sp. AS-1-15 TaxID=2874600 RepID=UPI001CC09444|nr:hypothetical protein [Myxococcus sp. AS-1-15]MBZ4402496.1 hypothetical protein [Myxococcus sp. AS-1-15]
MSVRLNRTWALERNAQGRVVLHLDEDFHYGEGGRFARTSVTFAEPMGRMVWDAVREERDVVIEKVLADGARVASVDVPTAGAESVPPAPGAPRRGRLRALGTAVARRVVYGLAAVQRGSPRLWRAAHNAVAHPLLEVLPARLGDALHDWTAARAFPNEDTSASPSLGQQHQVGEALDLDALESIARAAAQHDEGWELETAETSPELAEDPASAVHLPLEFRTVARVVAGKPAGAFLRVAGPVEAVPARARHLLAFLPHVVMGLLAELRGLRLLAAVRGL